VVSWTAAAMAQRRLSRRESEVLRWLQARTGGISARTSPARGGDGAVLPCEGDGGRRPRRTVVARLRLPSLMASGDDSDWQRVQRPAKAGRGGVAHSDSGGGACSFGPGGERQRTTLSGRAFYYRPLGDRRVPPRLANQDMACGDTEANGQAPPSANFPIKIKTLK
jgi:hypothetical protein